MTEKHFQAGDGVDIFVQKGGKILVAVSDDHYNGEMEADQAVELAKSILEAVSETLQPTQVLFEEPDLDSPTFTPERLNTFAARGFVRERSRVSLEGRKCTWCASVTGLKVRGGYVLCMMCASAFALQAEKDLKKSR